MHTAVRTQPHQSLEPFSQFLIDHGIPHQLVRHDGGWEIRVDHARDEPRVRRQYQVFAVDHGLPLLQDASPPLTPMRVLAYVLRIPLTISLLLATVAVTLWVGFGSQLDLMRLFTISDFEVQGNQLHFAEISWLLHSHEWWRLLSPTLLHFSMSHLVFNSLWLWILGTEVERLLGLVRYLVLLLILGLVANVCQFHFGGSPLFGGLSGVVFGLLAYCLILQGHRRYRGLRLSRGLWIFAAIYIGLGFTPLFATAGLGEMANAAHVAGLLAGLVMGLMHRLFLRLLAR